MDLLVVGLGNPGPEYEATRHNVGAETVRLVAARHTTKLRGERGTSADAAQLRIGDRVLALAVPQTYMNESGLAVRALVRRYLQPEEQDRAAPAPAPVLRTAPAVPGNTPASQPGTAPAPGAVTPRARSLVIVHDELDLEPGVVRVKVGGGTAGHNGLRSIQSHLHHLDFTRVRIGVGKPPGRTAGASYVLKRPSRAERALLEVAIEVAADAVECLLAEGPEAAMNRFNTR